MGSRFVLSLGTVGLALATSFAPRAEAQARNPVTMCKNGTRVNSEDSHACDRNGGVDLRATAIARHDEEVRAQSRAQATINNGDDRYGRNDDSRYGRNDDGRYGRGNGKWDNHDNGRRGNGRYSNAPRQVYRWQGLVDKEVRIQLQGGRAYIQPVGNREVRNGNGQMLGGLPHEDGVLRIERIEGRGDVDVIQQPSASNGYQATLRLRDPSSGAGNYRIVAYWQPLYNNNGRYGRN
jgi:hypothetical protein